MRFSFSLSFHYISRLTEANTRAKRRHPQMPGRSWRAVKASGDGKPVGPDRLLEKEAGRIDIGASEKQSKAFLFARLSLYL